MKVLILSSSTGGGHDLRAESFRRWSEIHHDLGFEVSVYRPLEATGLHYKWGVDFNNMLQIIWPAFHHLYWNILEYGMPLRFANTLIGMGHFRDLLLEKRPDYVLSVHPQLNHALFELTRKVLGRDKVKCVTYCGELDGGYGFSRHWVNPEADLFIGATEACCAQARTFGMPEEKTFLGGFMLRPETYHTDFSSAQREEYLHETLNLDPNVFTLLLSTGATGANNHCALLTQLDRARLKCQVVALCGRNPAILERVNCWRGANGTVTLRALPYSSDMFRLVSSVSAIVTRPGSGSTSESILVGCPVISNCLGGTMAQECCTLAGLQRWGALRRMNQPRDLAPIVREWIEQPGTLADTRRAMAAARPPGTPRAILERLAQLWAT
jgi:processive 1,2-diacylglycerol beta-glucosyltransferase